MIGRRDSRECEKEGGVKRAITVFVLQNIGILAGIVSLYILAKFQDNFHIQL